ncbi:MAG: 4Fe-4S single cluster domain-containing protein [Synechococcus sp.]
MNITTASISKPEIPLGFLNLMGYVDESEVNGPGRRAVVWLQGCDRHCDGCFNPASWSFDVNQLVDVESLAEQILSNPRNEGVTFSGGEPFVQAPELAKLARRVKAAGMSVMSFSGFTLAQLQSDNAPDGAESLLVQLDLLVDGPFVSSQAIQSPNSMVSSRNQRVLVFNPDLQDRLDWASDEIEIHILKDGRRIVTGYCGQLSFSE